MIRFEPLIWLTVAAPGSGAGQNAAGANWTSVLVPAIGSLVGVFVGAVIGAVISRRNLKVAAYANYLASRMRTINTLNKAFEALEKPIVDSNQAAALLRHLFTLNDDLGTLHQEHLSPRYEALQTANHNVVWHLYALEDAIRQSRVTLTTLIKEVPTTDSINAHDTLLSVIEKSGTVNTKSASDSYKAEVQSAEDAARVVLIAMRADLAPNYWNWAEAREEEFFKMAENEAKPGRELPRRWRHDRRKQERNARNKKKN